MSSWALSFLSERERWSVVWRRAYALAALGLVIYYAAYPAFFIPDYGFTTAWPPNDFGRVIRTVDASHPAAQHLKPGDVLLAVNGRGVVQTAWGPLFPPGQNTYQVTIQRETERQVLELPVRPATGELLRGRLTAGSVAALNWLVAALVLLNARHSDADARRAGNIFLILSVALAASVAALHGAPAGRLGSEPLFPLAAVGLIQLAILPAGRPRPSRENKMFKYAYGWAGVLSVAAVVEILVLHPRGVGLLQPVGLSLYHVFALGVGFSLAANPAILAVRFVRANNVPERRQIGIVLVFTMLAALPLAALYLLPQVLFGQPLLSGDFRLSMVSLLVLGPLSYGYVLYRRRYPGLDRFTVHTLTLLVLGLALLAFYAVLHSVLRQVNTLFLEPLLFALGFVLALSSVTYGASPLRRMVETLIYGSDQVCQDSLRRFTARFSADPEAFILHDFLAEVAGCLRVDRAVLLFVDEQMHSTCVWSAPPGLDDSHAGEIIRSFPKTLILKSQVESEATAPIWRTFAWAVLVLPLYLNGRPLGLLILGPPFPQGNFDARQVNFLEQISGVLAVSVNAVRLFEASLALSRQLVQIRDAERATLASQLHDEPLQRVSAVANALDQLVHKPPSDPAEITAGLEIQRRRLQETMQQLREICAGLYPPVLHQGMAYAVREAVYRFQDETGIRAETVLKLPNGAAIPPEITRAVYHILVEALTNVGKHAGANRVWIRVDGGEGRLRLSVADDGRGHDLPDASLADLVRDRHFGIVGMHTWANLVGGKLALRNRPDGGMQVTLEVSLHADALDDRSPMR